jgi:hypothetical protein
VGRDGIVYLSMDITQVQVPMVFQTQAKGYPLRFSSDEVVFYNTQGFLMQLLTQSIPGLFTIQAANGASDSDTLQYSRHEFATYFVQHQERQPHQLDPTDANWHLDGTPHVDHNHLVVEIAGSLNAGALPVPGATPPFELVLRTRSLFHHGLVGKTSISMSNQATTDSFSSRDGLFGSAGDILGNNTISLSGSAVVNGDATGGKFNLSGSAQITGTKITATQPAEFMPVSIPALLPNLGSLKLSGTTQTLVGPASYQVADLSISNNGRLVIDNAQGPVTLYVTGNVSVSGTGTIAVADPNPEKFAIYVAGSGSVQLSNGSNFYGVVYAPQSTIGVSGQGQFFGAFVGDKVGASGAADIHYYTALMGR